MAVENGRDEEKEQAKKQRKQNAAKDELKKLPAASKRKSLPVQSDSMVTGADYDDMMPEEGPAYGEECFKDITPAELDKDVMEQHDETMNEARRRMTLKFKRHALDLLLLKSDALLLAVVLDPRCCRVSCTGVKNAPDDVQAHFKAMREHAKRLVVKELLDWADNTLLDVMVVSDSDSSTDDDESHYVQGDRSDDLLVGFSDDEDDPGSPKCAEDVFKDDFDNYVEAARIYLRELMNRNKVQDKMGPPSVLVWWDSVRATALRPLAAKYLAIQATSANSERVFSASGVICRPRRSRMASDTLSALTTA